MRDAKDSYICSYFQLSYGWNSDDNVLDIYPISFWDDPIPNGLKEIRYATIISHWNE